MIKAKFIGSSSCGFQHGLTYNLISRNETKSFLFCKTKTYIWIFDMNSNAKCPYSSLEAFLRNWEVISNES